MYKPLNNKRKIAFILSILNPLIRMTEIPNSQDFSKYYLK